ncbi:MAG: hypothetical protein M1561_05230 [Gammaproteobacteria bacterium]|nr:hypothetical protein [Gammaproteobacteria bacterium]
MDTKNTIIQTPRFLQLPNEQLLLVIPSGDTATHKEIINFCDAEMKTEGWKLLDEKEMELCGLDSNKFILIGGDLANAINSLSNALGPANIINAKTALELQTQLKEIDSLEQKKPKRSKIELPRPPSCGLEQKQTENDMNNTGERPANPSITTGGSSFST